MKKVISFTISLFIAVLSYAQIAVSGKITDSKGEPVVGAVVMLKTDNSKAAVTDAGGKYSLSVPKDAVLVVSCLGFKTTEVEVSGRSLVDIQVEDDVQGIDEVVVVGYGSMRKSDLTGSVASVKIDEVQAERSNSLEELLQGKAAGVQIVSNSGAPDGAVSVRIRGLNSFNGDTQPLYVIDGVIMNSSVETESLITADPGSTDQESNGLLGINPQDIASIEILKDASASAIYGSLASNGVVLITTKTANRDKPVIKASLGVSVSKNYAKQDIMSFDEYVDYLSIVNPTELNSLYQDPATRTGLKVTPVDWQDFVMQTAVGEKFYLSISARPKTFSYTFSFGYNNNRGIIKNSGVEQYTMRLNVDKNLGKKVKLGVKMNMAYVTSDIIQGTASNQISSATSLIHSMLTYRPFMSGTYRMEEDIDEEEDESKSGPDRWLSGTSNRRVRYKITPNLYVSWNILPWLTFKSSFGGDCNISEVGKFRSREVNRYSATGSIGAVSGSRNISMNFDNTLSLKRKFYGGHNLSATLGLSATRRYGMSQTIEGWNVDQYKAMELSLNSAANTRISYAETGSSTMSFFARGIYNFKDRYVVTATYRLDGSSKFATGNKYAHFPSFAFAWRANQEEWFDSKIVSTTKLRLGWGRVGNQNFSNYQTTTNYSTALVPGTPEPFVSIYPSNIANPDLKWETTEQVNAGLDFAMWGGRLSLTVDGYYKITKDLLQQKYIPKSSGFSRLWVNNGEILNKGFELALDATPVARKDWEWTISGNFSLNRNTIRSIDTDSSYGTIYMDRNTLVDAKFFHGATIGSGSLANYPANIFIEGQQMGLFYGFVTDGIVQEGTTGVPTSYGGDPVKPGAINYLDLNGNGFLDDDDRSIIGNPNPDFTYGFSTSLTYKNFTLSANFAGSYGNDILNVNRIRMDNIYYSSWNHSRSSYYGALAGISPENNFPTFSGSKEYDRLHISDRYVEDGSYLRLSDLSLSYQIPIKKTSKIVKGINVTISGGNLFVWSKYSGWDPDVNSYGSNMMKMGLDAGSYPSARTGSFNLRFTF